MYIITIQKKHVGRGFFRVHRAFKLVEGWGTVLAIDVGKRCYASEGVVSIESVEQRDRRVGPR